MENKPDPTITVLEDWNEVDGKIYFRWKLKNDKEWNVKLTPYKEKPWVHFKYMSPKEFENYKTEQPKPKDN